jgi:formylmethanofuran dehydrogenase subunit E
MPKKFDDELILKDLQDGIKIKDILIKYNIKGSKTIYDIKKRKGQEPNGRNPVSYYLSKMYNVHNSKYEYPNIENEFVNSRSKVTIVCKDCSDIFTQTISHHIWSKSGCRKCFGNKILTIDEILDKSKLRHADIYSYPLIESEYVSSKSKITIICSLCNNIFYNNLHSHLIKEMGVESVKSVKVKSL